MEIRTYRQLSMSFQSSTEVMKANLTLQSKTNNTRIAEAESFISFLLLLFFFFMCVSLLQEFQTHSGVPVQWTIPDQTLCPSILVFWPKGMPGEENKHIQYFPFMCIFQPLTTSSSGTLWPKCDFCIYKLKIDPFHELDPYCSVKPVEPTWVGSHAACNVTVKNSKGWLIFCEKNTLLCCQSSSLQFHLMLYSSWCRRHEDNLF